MRVGDVRFLYADDRRATRRVLAAAGTSAADEQPAVDPLTLAGHSPRDLDLFFFGTEDAGEGG